MALVTFESFAAKHVITQVLDLKMKTISLTSENEWVKRSGDELMQGDISVFVFYFFSFFIMNKNQPLN